MNFSTLPVTKNCHTHWPLIIQSMFTFPYDSRAALTPLPLFSSALPLSLFPDITTARLPFAVTRFVSRPQKGGLESRLGLPVASCSFDSSYLFSSSCSPSSPDGHCSHCLSHTVATRKHWMSTLALSSSSSDTNAEVSLEVIDHNQCRRCCRCLCRNCLWIKMCYIEMFT